MGMTVVTFEDNGAGVEHEKAGDKTADHEGCLVGGSELMGMGNKYFWLHTRMATRWCSVHLCEAVR